MNSDHLFIYENIPELVTLSGAVQKKGRHPTEEDLGIIRNASLVVDTASSTIEWVGTSAELPKSFETVINRQSGEGVWFPELVECHTHLIFAGLRHHDYALRATGKSYLEIASRGGGILSTLTHTRKASMEELVQGAASELDRFQKYGVGTVEIKSGYGLSLESELKILNCVKALQEFTSVNLIPTFMPAHATPPEFKGKTDDYVNVICSEWLPTVAKEELATFFDVFIEEGFFTLAQAQKMCAKAKELGFGIKLHVDQFNNLGGTSLGLEIGATSLDHLEHVNENQIAAFAKAETVAVLLPGASLYTKIPYPPARKLLDAGARVALSTDYSPGTCPSRNLPLMTTLACSQMGMTIAEAIVGVTYNAAAALGLEDDFGSIQVGKPFRVCQFKAPSFEVLPYCFGEME